MAHPQPQTHLPPRTFSPAQQTPSPVGSQSAYPLPPTKRARTDGPSPQSASPSPHTMSSLATSPPNTGTPPTVGSPASAHGLNAQQANQPAPLTNGQTGPTLSLPDARPSPTLPAAQMPRTPQPITSPSTPQYTTATMTPIMNSQNPSTSQPSGVMGPPSRPADRPTKDYEYDVTDSLAGTGIDLRAEEQYLSELYGNSFDASSEARTGFAQYPPGGKSSFYGAGPANQPAEAAAQQDQKKFESQEAERVWNEAAMRLAVQRTQEIRNPFLLVASIHRRAEKIAKEHHLGINTDMRNNPPIGRMARPEQFPEPKVTITTKKGPDDVMVHTTGSWIPHDAFLADQMALISIATKQRLTDLVQDANSIAKNRQSTSHGGVPEEWEKAAAPLNKEPLIPIGSTEPAAEAADEDVQMSNGVDGDAVFSSDKAKRSADQAALTNGTPTKPTKMPKIASFVTLTMRDAAKQEREWEEARLRRRQKRQDGGADATNTPSRSDSIAPGTPGSVAPEPEKPMTKKEIKKNQALKAAEANSHANQNLTSSMFAGLGGKSGLFGKKKGGKTYDWMNVGRSQSGTSTPSRPSLGSAKASLVGETASNPTEQALTTEGRNRLGTWREDKEKGKNIQLRDWVAVLERDGREAKALQRAYMKLDTSLPH